MENKNSQDLRILKKAGHHVSFCTMFMFLLLILYFVALVYINNQIDFFTVSDSFKRTCFLLGAIQILVFGILNTFIMKGRKIARILYWLVFILEIGEFYFPMVAISDDPMNIISYVGLMLMMLLKLVIIGRFGSFLMHNKYTKILFDHVLEVSKEEAEAEEIRQEPVKEEKPVLSSYDFYHADFDESEFLTEEIQLRKEDKNTVIDEIEEFTFPQLAIRLAFVVYSSLAGFPILTNLLSEFLCSIDGKVVFAIKDIFMLCILSAVLWTFVILFLYYDHPKSKLLCNCCAIGEVLGLLFYLPKFIGYMNSEAIQYAPRVFILFAFLNLMRYVLLIMVLKPIYTYVEDEKSES
ncbi:MAG: hypothetical protein Q4C49_04515 [Bacillota bacterium]|nr:hypothetical protein [Bacillota bacterium]